MTDIHELAGAFACDATEPEERRQFELHLSQCGECRDEVAAFREVLGEVAESTALEPPEALAQLVLAGAVRGSDGGSVRPDRAERISTLDTARVSRAARQSGSGHLVRWAGLAAAACVLFSVGVGVGRNLDSQPAVTAQESSIAALAAAPDAHMLDSEISGTSTRILMSSEMGKGVVLASGLAAPDSGLCYQVWAVKANGAMISAGTFTPGPSGLVSMLLQGGIEGVVKFEVTIEPESGSRQPTGAPVAVLRA